MFLPKMENIGADDIGRTCRMIDPALSAALGQPDTDEVLMRAVSHADMTMRKYIWRGFRPAKNAVGKLMVGDKTAEDFVFEALNRFCDGARQYDPSKGLLENLNSVTDSLIWSHKKSSDRTGIVDYAKETTEEGLPLDPIAKSSTPELSADELLVQTEVARAQRDCFDLIRSSFDGDKQIQDYLDALSAGYTKSSDVAELTGIPVKKIYELRRKIGKYAPTFFGVTDYQELARKIREGKTNE